MSDQSKQEIAEGKLAIASKRDAAGRPEKPYILTLSSPACLTATDPADSVKSTRMHAASILVAPRGAVERHAASHRPTRRVARIMSRHAERRRGSEAGSYLFSGLSDRQLSPAGEGLQGAVPIPAGTRLTTQGEMSGVAFFVAAEGEAAVIVDGERVGTMGPGDHFGELAMISENERTATVEALTPMRCHTIQFWHFRAFAKKNPDVTWKLLQHVAGLLARERSRQPAKPGRASP